MGTITHFQGVAYDADSVDGKVRRYFDKPINFGYNVKYEYGSAPLSTGAGSSASGIVGDYAVSSTDSLDTIIKVPSDFDPAVTSFVDVAFWATGAATSVSDYVQIVGAYRDLGTGAGTAIGTAETTTGITDSGEVAVVVDGLLEGTITIDPDTLTAGNYYLLRATVGTTCTAPELRIKPDAVLRYARVYL